jgi:Ca-activated chloride channel family protein
MNTHGSFRALTPAVATAFDCVLLLAALLTCLSLAASGQTCAECAGSALPSGDVSAGEWSFIKEVNEVNLVFVAMRKGKFIHDLSQGEITLLDDKKPPASILGFRSEQELPLRVGLVIDTSSSVKERFRFEQQGADAFLQQVLRRKSDEAFVLGFSDAPKVVQDVTNDPKLLSQGVARLAIGGGTALYDAVAAGCEKLAANPELGMFARVLVVLSDGNNNSGKLSLEEAIDVAQQDQVVIYTISTNYRSTLDVQDWTGKEGNDNLRKLASETGGRTLKPPSAKAVGQAFAKIVEELRNRYAIAYRPADFKADGHYRKITIAARRQGKKLNIRTRKGYYARLVSLASNSRRTNGAPE